jgi:hypothetical protein
MQNTFCAQGDPVVHSYTQLQATISQVFVITKAPISMDPVLNVHGVTGI